MIEDRYSFEGLGFSKNQIAYFEFYFGSETSKFHGSLVPNYKMMTLFQES